MRKSFVGTAAIIAVISLSLSSVWADPLAPGKPAGVHAAQMGNTEVLVFGGVGLAAAAVLIANVGSGDHAASATQPITVVAPTTT